MVRDVGERALVLTTVAGSARAEPLPVVSPGVASKRVELVVPENHQRITPVGHFFNCLQGRPHSIRLLVARLGVDQVAQEHGPVTTRRDEGVPVPAVAEALHESAEL